MTVLGTAVAMASVMLAVAVVLAFLRLLRGPSLPDRVVAFDLMTTLAVGIMAVYTVSTGETVFLDVAIVLALISFLGTVAFARYLEQRGRKKGGES
jgi:multicomponent Na+:H+ antiporter subunit F